MSEDVAAAKPFDFNQQLQSLLEAAPGWLPEIGASFGNFWASGQGAWPFALVVILLAGFGGERLACWKLNTLNRTICDQTSNRWSVVAGYALVRMLFDLAGVLLFGVFAWLAIHLTVDSSIFRGILKDLVVAIVTFRAWMVVMRAILAPKSEGIRPLVLSGDDARVFYRWIAVFVGAYVFIVLFLGKAIVAEITPVLGRATYPILGLLLNIILNLFVWTNRARIARLFASRQDTGAQLSVLQQVLSQSWPFMFTAWMLMLWASWAYAIFTGDAQREQSTLVSWWITLLFPVGDRLINALLHKLSGLRFLRDTGFEKRRERFVAVVQTCVRVILMVVALVALAVTWNMSGTGMLQTAGGQRVIWAAVDVGVIVLIAYVLYEVVMSMLDKHMPDEEEQEAEIEGEGGGTGATRQETLAPLLRGTFVVLLGAIVVLTVLSSLGIQILPLIAGASIIGVAIGFGSQKLVQDVISGVFFLIDDAFRRGEYIDVGSVKGTVEKISIRSMQLRHHKGALHTIPFGEIRHLTNYSRDWVLMKLKLRLTYDTDVEKVRKLIKQLGQELLEDAELGPLFLQPLKSQGVYSMEDDSAMIIRVKFMTKPGDQFIVRKTVYSKIRELFEREAIEFAHRVVSVRLDGADASDLSDEEKRRVAGAALAARAEAT